MPDLALYGVGDGAARDFDDIFPFLGDGLRKAEHTADLFEHAVYLCIEIVVVVDDPQMGMSCPCLYDIPVAHACLVKPLGAQFVGGRVVILLSAVCRGNKMQHGVIAVEELLVGDITERRDLLPHLFGEIGGDVEGTAVTDDDYRLVDRLRHGHEVVFKS